MAEIIATPKTTMSTVGGDIAIVGYTDEGSSEVGGPSITGSCDFLFWR
jgi:hypothetical protein